MSNDSPEFSLQSSYFTLVVIIAIFYKLEGGKTLEFDAYITLANLKSGEFGLINLGILNVNVSNDSPEFSLQSSYFTLVIIIAIFYKLEGEKNTII